MSSCETTGHRCPDCWVVVRDGHDLLMHRVTECIGLSFIERYTLAFDALNGSSPVTGSTRKAMKAAIIDMAGRWAGA